MGFTSSQPLILAALLVFGASFPDPARAEPIPARFAGSDLVTGKPVSLELGTGAKATVVVFLSARCPCSASHERKLAELYAEFAPRGFQFLGLHSNADEKPELTARHFPESHLPFPVLEDPGAREADRFGALKTPHAFVLGPRGDVLYQGGVDDSHVAQESKRQFLKEALAAIAEGRKPERKEARALGCVIARP
jgi:hypothetical protein